MTMFERTRRKVAGLEAEGDAICRRIEAVPDNHPRFNQRIDNLEEQGMAVEEQLERARAWLREAELENRVAELEQRIAQIEKVVPKC